VRLITDVAQEADLSQAVEVPELTMPVLVAPEMVMPSDDPVAIEV
jgi:hypothetical protein